MCGDKYVNQDINSDLTLQYTESDLENSMKQHIDSVLWSAPLISC